MWCLRDSKEIPSRVSSTDVVLCLQHPDLCQSSVQFSGRDTHFSRRVFTTSLAADILTLI